MKAVRLKSMSSPVCRRGWWEGFVDQVSFESGMEERGSDGEMVVTDDDDDQGSVVDGMKQEGYSKDWVMHNGKSDL